MTKKQMFVVVTTIVSGFLSSARAEGPRQSEVDGRAANQEDVNNTDAATGALKPGQAAKLDAKDEAIQAQKQRQADRNGGYIKKRQQVKDNREENKVNQQRNRMIEKNEINGTTTTVTP